MQKQLRILKVRRWNILAVALCKFCRDSVEVCVFSYKLSKYYVYKKRNLILYVLTQT